MLFVSISFACGSQRAHSFQWNMGLTILLAIPRQTHTMFCCKNSCGFWEKLPIRLAIPINTRTPLDNFRVPLSFLSLYVRARITGVVVAVYLYIHNGQNPLSVDMSVCLDGIRETYDNKGQ